MIWYARSSRLVARSLLPVSRNLPNHGSSESNTSHSGRTFSKGLVIVESPAKAKTIQKYLGKGFTVDASFGHVKDLPKSSLGVDLENDFETEYVVIPGKEKVLAKLKKLALSADHIYLAPDPDREGEAIAAHLADELGEDSSKKKK